MRGDAGNPTRVTVDPDGRRVSWHRAHRLHQVGGQARRWYCDHCGAKRSACACDREPTTGDR